MARYTSSHLKAVPLSHVPQSPSPVPTCSETYADIMNHYAPEEILTLQDTASKRETEDTQVCHCLEDSLKAHTETQAQLEKSRKAHSDTSVLLDDMFHRVECMGRMIDKSHATALRTQANYAVLQTRMFEREAEYEKQQDELRTAQRQLDQKTRETTTEVNCLCQQRETV
ncbi:hypothetical protein L227DRAFT_617806 [Lentinus tigrinus ALCF2SS1-6]|uniref:Uncharacterized protein n=1 Tax=Lentinus tigrinus ALCF2SS1-6 TaxID=1328759 RepID=A0A5C2RLL3_9APHY|nr:hypothetical protein L227DRAFT_617806 [Lentinus tigrinus ALCF2SS1-6]